MHIPKSGILILFSPYTEARYAYQQHKADHGKVSKLATLTRIDDVPNPQTWETDYPFTRDSLRVYGICQFRVEPI